MTEIINDIEPTDYAQLAAKKWQALLENTEDTRNDIAIEDIREIIDFQDIALRFHDESDMNMYGTQAGCARIRENMLNFCRELFEAKQVELLVDATPEQVLQRVDDLLKIMAGYFGLFPIGLKLAENIQVTGYGFPEPQFVPLLHPQAKYITVSDCIAEPVV